VNDSSLVRMVEAELTSELYVAMLSGLQDKTKTLNAFYEKYEDSFPKRKQVEQQFRAIIDTIGNLFSGRLGDSEYRRRTLFYSLFCVLFDFQYGLPNSPTHKNGTRQRIPTKLYPQILTNLDELADQIQKDNPDKEYIEFVEAYRRHTNDLESERERRRPEDDERILVNPYTGDPITRPRLYQRMLALGKRASVPDAHPHRYRDTFAVDMLARGASPYDVAKLLGDTAATIEKHYAPFVKELRDRTRRIMESGEGLEKTYCTNFAHSQGPKARMQ